MEKFDAIIIGSGQTGNPLAKRLSKENMRGALVEQAFIGGTCINYGCTPAKTLVGVTRSMARARQTAEYGIIARKENPDYKVIHQRINKVVADFRKGMNTSARARAIESGKTTGFLKAIVDNKTSAVSGVAVICAGGGELMSLLQVAMMGGIKYEQLRDTMFAHLTYAEAINNLFSPIHLKPGGSS